MEKTEATVWSILLLALATVLCVLIVCGSSCQAAADRETEATKRASIDRGMIYLGEKIVPGK